MGSIFINDISLNMNLPFFNKRLRTKQLMTIRIDLDDNAIEFNFNLRDVLIDTIEDNEIGEFLSVERGEGYMALLFEIIPSKKNKRKIESIRISLNICERSLVSLEQTAPF